MDTIRALQGLFGVAPGQPWLGITQLGSDLAYLATLVLYFFLAGPRDGRVVGIFFGLSALLNVMLKDLTQIPRPFVTDPSVASSAAVATAGGYAFPSGHAMVTATLWVLMALQRQSKLLWGVALLLTLLVGFSRVVLGVHYLSDVLVGFLLGVVLALVGASLGPALQRVAQAPYPALLTWLPPLLMAGAALFVNEEWGRALGIAAGFWLCKSAFAPSSHLGQRLLHAGLGLALGLGLYLLSSALLPGDLKRSGIGAFVRFALLIPLITDGLPRLLRLPTPRPATS